jgi:hypothetical protein
LKIVERGLGPVDSAGGGPSILINLQKQKLDLIVFRWRVIRVGVRHAKKDPQRRAVRANLGQV